MILQTLPEKKMDFIRDPRDAFSVPSTRCQSLLGKALQEHFTIPQHVASVFSSSSSLRNSSAGANFITNFRIDAQSAKLFSNIFTPEDCFSLQFAPEITLISIDLPENWNRMYSFFEKFISRSRFLEASLKSLTLLCKHINNQQLHFIIWNLKRLTKLKIQYFRNGVSPAGMNNMFEHLSSSLVELHISECDALLQSDNNALEGLPTRLKNLKSLHISQCDAFPNRGLASIAQTTSLTSLTLPSSDRLTPAGFNLLASLENLQQLTVSGTSFNGENLETISSTCHVHLQQLFLLNCNAISAAEFKNLTAFQNLQTLDVSYCNNNIKDQELDYICSLSALTDLRICYLKKISDQNGIAKLVSSLPLLKNLDIHGCTSLSDVTLEILSQKATRLERVDIEQCMFSLQAVHSLAMSSMLHRGALTTIAANLHDRYGPYSKVASAILKQSAIQGWFLDLSHMYVSPKELPSLLELIGEERCLGLEEIWLKQSNAVGEAGIDMIAEKCKNLKRINLEGTFRDKETLKNFIDKMPNCQIKI